MNVLMFSPAFDYAGGAVIAANRLFHGLQKQGVDSKMLVGKSEFEDNRVNIIPHNFVGEKLLSRLTMALGLNYIHYYSSYRITKHPFYQKADVLNFHTIHSGYFNYRALPELTQFKPAVFTLHDVWGFTGHCGFNYDCERWKTGCGKCPYPDSYPPIKYDNTSLEWKLKKSSYKRSRITFVTPSKWLTSLAKQSMLGEFDIHTIPNGLDTDVFSPLDPEQCKSELNIPKDKKIILFGAMGLSDKRKGGDLLVQALNKMPEKLKNSVLLLTFGHPDEEFTKSVLLPTMHLGYISDDRIKSKIFSASDIFVFPTRNDNLPCIIQESLSCGTPVVSFNVNGIPELIRDNFTGFLAEPEDTDSLLEKITQLLENDQLRVAMKKNCRSVAVEEYNLALQAKRYIDLYSSILSPNVSFQSNLTR